MKLGGRAEGSMTLQSRGRMTWTDSFIAVLSVDVRFAFTARERGNVFWVAKVAVESERVRCCSSPDVDAGADPVSSVFPALSAASLRRLSSWNSGYMQSGKLKGIIPTRATTSSSAQGSDRTRPAARSNGWSAL